MIQLLLLAALIGDGNVRWLEWGGPTRDFHVPDAALAPSWPTEGPRRIWSRELGDGYSAVLADGSHLYTVFRRNNQNVAIALDAASGRTTWEQAFD